MNSRSASRCTNSKQALGRREFVVAAASAPILSASTLAAAASPGRVRVERPGDHESLFGFIDRTAGQFDLQLFRQLLGACNEFKEGDELEGVAADDLASRRNARQLLSSTSLGEFLRHTVFDDEVVRFARRAVNAVQQAELSHWTFGQLHRFLVESDEATIRPVLAGLDSDVIACVVKLMTNQQLNSVGAKIFNPLPGSKIGAKGYLSARIQPNSPTDNIEDIQWQVFNGWSFAVGDALLGTNPVSSEVGSVAAIEKALSEIIEVFGLQDVLPHCVLAHIDVQAAVEVQNPGTTALWFQSLAGVDDANRTFDISVPKMSRHAQSRAGRYGLYFETGQGADATNGHGKGFDMVIHESRKYGFARALKQIVAQAQDQAGRDPAPWVHLNDVAGFIGPEVFRTRDQLVRCCLEDIVMGKLHELTIGLDICSTLHMEVDLDDLDWCIDQIMPACPAYLMALPTKNDPMLSYLTTAFQDHVRVRHRFATKVNDAMWAFFQELGVIDAHGEPTEHFGQPAYVYLQFRRRQGDARPEAEILSEAKQKISQVQGRGVPVAEGFGAEPWEMEPALDRRIRSLYDDSKRCLWAELPEEFSMAGPNVIRLSSESQDREDYILHPQTGERLDNESMTRVKELAVAHAGQFNVQIVISDGLNALSLADDNHLGPFLIALRGQLAAAGLRASPQHLVVRTGRVRAGYQIGELLFGQLSDTESKRAVIHIIGERPGSGHHAFSAYLSAPNVESWAQAGVVDHNISKVVSGIADTALSPSQAAEDTVRLLRTMMSDAR